MPFIKGFSATGVDVPVGTLIDFAGSTAPSGYLVCDGSAISRTIYAVLFSVIGITYGTGDGSTTFTLPNLVDRFKEGSSSVGTYKSAGLPNITGSAGVRQLVAIGGGSGALKGFSGDNTSAQNECALNDNWNGQGAINLDASQCNSIYGNSTTVQPPALTVLPCIKY